MSLSGATRKALKIVIPVLVVLIAVRIWLPSFIQKQVNKQLRNIDGYEGSVGDVDLLLIAGEYSIDSVELNKKSGEVPVPFFSAKNISFSVEWQALFHGEIVGEIIVDSPKLNYVKGPTEETSQTEVDGDWTAVVDSLMPLKINRFEINDGEIHYRDFHSDPKVDILMENVNIVATNLTNARDDSDPLPASVSATAKLYEGNARLDMKLDPLNASPTFDLNAELTTLNLTNLNNFLRAYGNFDVKKGNFSLYAEAAAEDKKITGYVKPLIKDIEVVQWQEEGTVVEKIWERVVGAVAWVFENKSEDQLATQINIQGSIENPDIDLWTLIGQVLRNAFIEALYPALENSISIGSVGQENSKQGFFENLVDGSKEEDKK